jgi:hypothetical protein
MFLSASRSPAWPSLLLLCAALLLAYASALLVPFGHSDDYIMLFHQEQGWGAMNAGWFSAQGRPLLGWLDDLALDRLHTVEGLAAPRAAGLLLLLGVAGLLFRRLAGAGLPPGEAALLAAACTLSPAAAVFVGWAILSLALLGALAALLAAEFSAQASSGRTGKIGNWLHPALAVLLLLITLLTYQPLAPLFLLAALLDYAFDPDRGPALRRLLAALAVYLAALALYFALYKLLIVPTHAESAGALARARLDLSVRPVLAALGGEIVPMAFGGWEYFGSGVPLPGRPDASRLTVTLAALALLSPAALAGLSDGPGGWRARLVRLAVLLAVWVVSLLPMLVLHDHYAPTRTLFFSYALAALLAYLGLKRLSGGRPWPAWLAAGATLLLAGQAGLGFWDGLVHSQGREYALLSRAVLAFTERPAALVFVQPPLQYRPDGRPATRHEYYIYSAFHTWVPGSLANLAWNRREGLRRGPVDNPRLRHTVVHETRPGEPLPAGAAPVVDARRLLAPPP